MREVCTFSENEVHIATVNAGWRLCPASGIAIHPESCEQNQRLWAAGRKRICTALCDHCKITPPGERTPARAPRPIRPSTGATCPECGGAKSPQADHCRKCARQLGKYARGGRASGEARRAKRDRGANFYAALAREIAGKPPDEIAEIILALLRAEKETP